LTGCEVECVEYNDSGLSTARAALALDFEVAALTQDAMHRIAAPEFLISHQASLIVLYLSDHRSCW
jgi:hypothetical protein